ncbi:MAG TPA: hypothetical protein DEF51_47345 [Myxococcales bacterium]|nr:hypothetical protein [Myxococcales bacterium]
MAAARSGAVSSPKDRSSIHRAASPLRAASSSHPSAMDAPEGDSSEALRSRRCAASGSSARRA